MVLLVCKTKVINYTKTYYNIQSIDDCIIQVTLPVNLLCFDLLNLLNNRG